MNKNMRIDVYVENIGSIGNESPWNLYFHYNNVEFCLLYQQPESATFAKYFKRKIHGDLPGAYYTDDHGWRKTKDDENSVLSRINGIDNIKADLYPIISACTNLDIQADLVVHLDGKEYVLVSDCSDHKYIANNPESKKGYNQDVLYQLDIDLDSLDIPPKTSQGVK